MKPITFRCTETLRHTPEEIARMILDLGNWVHFQGYGPLPGIKAAEFEVLTPNCVGTRIRVTNTDGSKHVEEIAEWAPERRLRLEMKDFSPPLLYLAAGISELWVFELREEGTQVIRTLEMHPRWTITRPFLWLISLLLKRAIAQHLRQMQASQPSTADSGDIKA